MLSPDYSKRSYLLPKGCKDLIDALKVQAQQQTPPPWPVGQPSGKPPPIKGDILVSENSSPRELAALLGQKPFKIIADLIKLGVFAGAKQPLDFEAIRKVALKYGWTARKRKRTQGCS